LSHVIPCFWPIFGSLSHIFACLRPLFQPFFHEQDEPTSGLDANAAAIVIRALKRLADSGRAICATIHQPSVALFNFFDNLLLLKRGGETVYFGDLGFESSKLIEYFEGVGTTPKIRSNENPATW
jgi:ABC-type multidrug transport system ATPase subunit